jgi:hypothetical protein
MREAWWGKDGGALPRAKPRISIRGFGCLSAFLRANLGKGAFRFLFELLRRNASKLRTNLIYDLEPLFAFAHEKVKSFKVVQGDNRRDWNPALFDDHALFMAVDLVDERVEVAADIGDFHRFGDWLVHDRLDALKGVNGT